MHNIGLRSAVPGSRSSQLHTPVACYAPFSPITGPYVSSSCYSLESASTSSTIQGTAGARRCVPGTDLCNAKLAIASLCLQCAITKHQARRLCPTCFISRPVSNYFPCPHQTMSPARAVAHWLLAQASRSLVARPTCLVSIVTTLSVSPSTRQRRNPESRTRIAQGRPYINMQMA